MALFSRTITTRGYEPDRFATLPIQRYLNYLEWLRWEFIQDPETGLIEGLNSGRHGFRTEAIILQPQLKDILLLGSTSASHRTSHSALTTADSTSHTEKRGKEETFEVLFFQK